MNVYIGFDNGISGSIGVITPKGAHFHPMSMFTFREQNYTKKRAVITRVDGRKLTDFLAQWKEDEVKVFIERPMVNPQRFQTTISAVRCLEAVLQVLELLVMNKAYLDSREWQKVLLPVGTKGPGPLKHASREIGTRLFPQFADAFKKQGDADGMLIAEYCRRFYVL